MWRMVEQNLKRVRGARMEGGEDAVNAVTMAGSSPQSC